MTSRVLPPEDDDDLFVNEQLLVDTPLKECYCCWGDHYVY